MWRGRSDVGAVLEHEERSTGSSHTAPPSALLQHLHEKKQQGIMGHGVHRPSNDHTGNLLGTQPRELWNFLLYVMLIFVSPLFHS